VLTLTDQNVKDLKDEKVFKHFFAFETKIPTGTFLNPNNAAEYFNNNGEAGKVLADFYRRNPNLFFNEKFWQQCEDTGIIANEITDASGTKPFIPISPLGGSSY
jgi:hypothetical protein